MSGISNLNQPLNSYPVMNYTFPTGLGTEGHNRTIDDEDDVSEYDVNTAFIKDHREHNRIRQRAYQREMLDHQRMVDKLNKDSQFSDGKDRDSCNTYLKSELDRISIISRQCHLEKLKRECHARWFTEELKGETSNSVVEDLRRGHTPFLTREPNDSSSNSLLDSYKAFMEEVRLRFKHKEDEISILKRDKEDYALMFEENFRKSDQRLRDKEDENHSYVVSTDNNAVLST